MQPWTIVHVPIPEESKVDLDTRRQGRHWDSLQGMVIRTVPSSIIVYSAKNRMARN